jgi:hypothetical protein
VAHRLAVLSGLEEPTGDEPAAVRAGKIDDADEQDTMTETTDSETMRGAR